MKIIIAFAAAIHLVGYGQGFVNLSFEATNLGADPAIVPAQTAIPGWVPYINGISQESIVYNTVPLGAAAVTLQGPGGDYSAIHGSYFVYLWGQYRPSGGPGDSAAIGQTGQIPVGAQSLLLWGAIGGTQITFNGDLLGFQVVGTTGGYSIYAADISTIAGQTGELRFTAPVNVSGVAIDNIQFSSVGIPEPTTLSLLGLGLLALGWWRRKRE